MISDKLLRKLEKTVSKPDMARLSEISIMQGQDGSYFLFNKYTIRKNNDCYIVIKDYVAEIGEADQSTIQEINRTTKLVVSRVNLIGVQRTGYKVVHEKDGYRAFVKLRYAADQSNKLLVSEIRKNRKLNAKLESSKSFRELEQSIDSVIESKQSSN
jgi:hypothetical protein